MQSDFHGAGPRRSAAARGKAGLAAGALLLTGSLIGWGASTGGFGAASAAPARSDTVATAPAAARTIGAGGDSYAGIVQEIAPAVVTVRSERRLRAVAQDLPDDPLFRRFFGDRIPRQPQERREGALGSGVIVRNDGYILTNHHVIDAAQTVKVELTDGRTFDARVVGSDPATDLAVLKVDAPNLHTLPLGDSDAVRVGDIALAVGNPLGVGQTVTMGIVSAKGRATGAGDGSYEDFIQTDAPINQGNSGGALVNARGELIGINSQILSPSGGNIGIGFAIPANMARNVMDQLIDHGEVRRGLLGVTVQAITSDLAKSLGLSNVQGALVSSVQPGGAADKAGVKRGDVITAINGQPVKDSNTLRNEIGGMLPGTDAKLTVNRGGREQNINVRLGALKPARSTTDDDEGGAAEGAAFGLAVEPLTAETARRLNVGVRSGVVVTDVRPSSRAADAGLRPGDVIEEVDGQKVDSAESLKAALGRNPQKPALLLVHRGDATVFVPLERRDS